MALPDIFDRIMIAVERNDRVLLHEQFVALMTLQDQLVREHAVDCLCNGAAREGARW